MRRFASIVCLLALVATGCQRDPRAFATVQADARIVQVASGSRLPGTILHAAGVHLEAGDVLLNNGIPIVADQIIERSQGIHLAVRTATPVLINGEPRLTTVSTVAEALQADGRDLYVADLLDPPANTAISPGMLITFQESSIVLASVDGKDQNVRASSNEAGSILSDAGLPPEGLDATMPQTGVPIEAGAVVHLTRITETSTFEQHAIPFENKITDSPELELGIEQVVSPGAEGLAVTRTRIQRQDGTETKELASSPVVIVEPQDRLVLRGTKLVERTEVIEGLSLTFWWNTQMYATVYSPCNSATPGGGCSTGTASGRPAGKGVVAVDPALFASLNGQRLYIPGYGFAVIGDVGGGYIIEQQLGISRYKWIDLGFDDGNIQDMTGWIPVYFLSPAPASVPDVLR